MNGGYSVKPKTEKKRKKTDGLSTKEFIGITGITEYSLRTSSGEIVFFIIKPTNISVLSEAGINARIHSLLNVVKGQSDIEMLALNSTESFESNKNYYRTRLETEELPAVRKLLEQDSNHLDRIQALMSSAREFYIMVRLQDKEQETEILPFLSRLEKSIEDNGFIAHRASKEDIKRILGVYFEQNVTTNHYDNFDGERWFTAEENTHPLWANGR